MCQALFSALVIQRQAKSQFTALRSPCPATSWAALRGGEVLISRYVQAFGGYVIERVFVQE